MKNTQKLLGLFLAAISFTACSKDDTNGNVSLNAKTTFTNSRMPEGTASGVALTSFMVNIKEIEFEFDDDQDDNLNQQDFNFDDDVKLVGPWTLDLLNSTRNIVNFDLPNGVYEEIEFKLDKNEIVGSPMFNKSIEVKGTISGTPFVYWDNEDEDIEVDYSDISKNVIINNNSLNLSLNFNLRTVFVQTLLSLALDRDGDGVIEIGPNDQDGNSNIAEQLDDRLEDTVIIE